MPSNVQLESKDQHVPLANCLARTMRQKVRITDMLGRIMNGVLARQASAAKQNSIVGFGSRVTVKQPSASTMRKHESQEIHALFAVTVKEIVDLIERGVFNGTRTVEGKVAGKNNIGIAINMKRFDVIGVNKYMPEIAG
ncbi:hypothetical protein ACHAQJ_005945 [Trichoderma viride]